MKREFLISKIDNAVVNQSGIEYEGSITISKEIAEAADILEYQRVDVNNKSNGERINTYVIYTDKPNFIGINGAASWKFSVGDIVHINAYGSGEKPVNPTIVKLKEGNEL